jgi:hypothetical protein
LAVDWLDVECIDAPRSRGSIALITRLENVASVFYRGAQRLGDYIGREYDVTVPIKHVAAVGGHNALPSDSQAGAPSLSAAGALGQLIASDETRLAPLSLTMQAKSSIPPSITNYFGRTPGGRCVKDANGQPIVGV